MLRQIKGLALTGLVVLASASTAADEMVSIPAGLFTMGRNDGPADERPAHAVMLPAFLIERLPVTNRSLTCAKIFDGKSMCYEVKKNGMALHACNGDQVTSFLIPPGLGVLHQVIGSGSGVMAPE